MISKDQYLMGRDKTFASEYNEELSDNADSLLIAVNEFLKDFAGPIIVNSGFRPPTINSMTPNAAQHSKHQTCEAMDLNDPSGALKDYILSNLDKATALNLYFEHFNWTRTKTGGWTHIQLGGPKSRKRIFIPSAALPFAPNFWDGKYDSKWDK